MGEIQNSLNSMMNSVAGAALGMKHIYNQQVSNYDSAVAQEANAQTAKREAMDVADQAQTEYNDAALAYNNDELKRPQADVRSDLATATEKVNKANQHIADYQAQFDPEKGGIGAPTKNQLKYIAQLERKAKSLEMAQQSYKVELDTKVASKQNVENLKQSLERKRQGVADSTAAVTRAQAKVDAAKQNKYLKGGKK